MVSQTNKRMSLRLKPRIYLLFASATFITLVIIVLTIFFVNRTQEREAWRNRQIEAASATTRQIVTYIDQIQRTQNLFSVLSTVVDAPRLQILLQSVLMSGPNINEIVITNANGAILVDVVRADHSRILENPIDKEWFEETLEEAPDGAFFLGEMEFLPNGNPYFILASKTRNGGVIAFQVNALILSDLVRNLQFGKTGNAYLAEGEGLIVAHTDVSVIEARTSLEGIQDLPETEDIDFIPPLTTYDETLLLNDAEYVNFQGKSVIGITKLIPGTDILLFVEVSPEEVFATSTNTLIALSGFAIFSWVFSLLGFTRLLNDLLFEPLNNLQIGQNAITKGDVGYQVTVLREDEVGAVTSGFNAMSQELAERNRQKAEQEKRLRALYNVMAQPFDSVDEQLKQALRIGAEFLNMDIGIISQIEGDKYTVLYAYTADDSLKTGQEFAFKQTYCDLTYHANDLVNIHHMKESTYYQHPAYASFGLESYIGVPLTVGGRRFGTLNFSSPKMRPTPFVTEDKDFFVLMGKWVSAVLERQFAEKELKQRDAILEAVAYSSEKLLKTSNWQNAIQDILNRLGSATQASRVYIFQNQPIKEDGALLIDQIYEWVAEGITPEINNPDLQNLSMDAVLPRWKTTLSMGELISGFVKDFPASEREILEPQQIISLVVLPIFVHDEWWGFIGFDECKGARVWHPLEIDALRSAANNLGATIQRQDSERVVQSQNETLVKANRELAIARRQAEAANALKSQFLSTMSHELRTPLNAVIGYAQLQLAGIVGDMSEEQKGFQERILINAQHLLGLINEVLDLSKIEAGRMELAERPFSLKATLHEIVIQNRVLAENKGLSLELNYDDRIPEVLVGDRGRIKQVIINLISNAIKFTDAGKISIEAILHTKDAWRLTVTDTGIGIASHQQETIFDEFRQTELGMERGGTGLGLAIVKKLVLMMGGNIRVTSELGQGSSFMLTMPIITQKDESTEDTLIGDAL